MGKSVKGKITIRGHEENLILTGICRALITSRESVAPHFTEVL